MLPSLKAKAGITAVFAGVGVCMLLASQIAFGQNVISWGANGSGQATVPASATNVVAVAAGSSNSLALRADGTLIAWGSISSVPNNITNAIAIAAGASHNLAVLASGSVVAWGSSAYGQANVPLSATNVVAIAAGDDHTLALRRDGKIMAWGKGTSGQTNIPPQCTNIVAIAAGGDLSLALRDDGECFIWGAAYRSATRTFRSVNDMVAISLGARQQVALTVAGLAVGQNASVLSPVTNLVVVASSTNYSLGLSADGRATAWGDNSLINLPAAATNLIAIAAGPFHCLAVTEDSSAPRLLQYWPAYQGQSFPRCRLPLYAGAVGNRPLAYQWLADGVPILGGDTPAPNLAAALGTDNVKYQVVVSNVFGSVTSAVATILVRPLKIWGADYYAQTKVPSAVNNTDTFAVAGGAQHCLALNSNGVVSAWGKNQYGQITIPPAAINIVAIAAGGNHSLALKGDGTVIAWGLNWNGQTFVPFSAKNVIDISAGWAHSLALRADGSLVGWGDDQYGQRGVTLFGMNAIAIASGHWHNMVLRSDGTVATSGLDHVVPESVTNVVAIAAGWETCLALRADGTVVAWGDNSYGQCNVPPEATNVVAIYSGYYHSVALRSDGSLVAWGMEYCGSTIVPAGMTEVAAIAAGGEFNMAVAGTGPPRFARQLTSVVAQESGQAVLSLKVQGKYPMSLQWQQDGLPVPGATNRFLLITNLNSSHEGSYTLVASNAFSQVTSGQISLLVKPVAGAATGVAEWREAPYGRQHFVSQGAQPTCAIAAGGFHRLALSADGTVRAWGKNADGQINVPPEATNIVAIAAGGDHSLVLKDDGMVLAWGRNWDGQTNVPSQVNNIVAISAGWAHSLALRVDGVVMAWGNNTYGQSSVSFLATDVTAVSAGYYHSMALRADGQVVTWGLDYPVPPSATNVVAIAAGWEMCLALRADGSVVAWGNNSYGQRNIPLEATNVVAISSGYYHCVALRADGALIAWGSFDSELPAVPRNTFNVAGIAAGEDYNLVLVGTGKPRFGRPLRTITAHAGGQAILQLAVQATRPVAFHWLHEGIPLDGATNRFLLLPHVQSLAAGNYVLVASNAFGQASSQPVSLLVQPDSITVTAVGAWGDDVRGQCDIPPTLLDPRAIAAGAFHSLALQADGSVVAWGKNVYGQTNVPPALTNVIAIAAGSDHSLALQQDGSVTAWGRNGDGQTNVPPAATNVMAIAAGCTHSVALKDDGSVIAWGDNEYDQTNVPPLASDVLAIAAGYYHTLALRSDHKVVSWGSRVDVPASASNVVAVAAGWEHSLALRVDGTVVAWGDNSYGQCNVPLAATNFVSISAGYGHSAGLRADGTVVAWGTGNYAVTNVPGVLHNVASLAAGENHIVALVESGPPRFQRESRPATAHVGGRAYFDADLRGSHPLARQWLRNGLPIPSATNQYLLVNDLQAGDAGTYVLAATNSVAITSGQPASLAVLTSPSIETGFPDLSSPAGMPISILADVSGTPPLRYQWRLNNVDLHDGPRITGADSVSIQINPAQYSDTGDYTLVVSNTQGVVTGLVARLTVTPLLAWGDNTSGQLKVPMGASNIVATSAGGDHSLALRADGVVLAWGNNSAGQTNVPVSATNVVSVAAGDSHSLALTASGQVLAWGDNTYGQVNVPPQATTIVALAAGDWHSLALNVYGQLFAWGRNSDGQTNVPTSATNVVAISAGGNYSLALRTDGSLVAWGSASATSSNQNVAIAAGGTHWLALLSNGLLAASGRNYYSQTTVPDAATNIVAISAGGDHSLVLRNDGSVVSWGGNYSGQTSVPTAATNIAAVSAGGAHTLALIRQSDLPPITSQWAKAAELGQSVFLVATPQVGTTATYQWQLNGSKILAATNSALFVTNLHWTNSGSYRVVISNSFGTTIGSPVILTVLRTPLWFDPASLSLPSQGSEFKLRLLGASGTGPVVIYASSNLSDWLPIFTNPPTIGPLDYSDSQSTSQSFRFYRASESQ